MKKLSKEKRLHLVLVILATAGVIAGLWLGVVSMQKNKLREIAQKSQGVQHEMDKIQKVAVEANEVQLELHSATNRLNDIEEAIPSASGDLFSWIVSSLKQFNVPSYKVEMPQISSPTVGDVRMFPTFPYSQAVVTVSGSAYYYEFGKFVADLENRFPYLRVENLNLEPGFGSTPEEREKLSFHMEIVTLVKPVNH
jgi:Tfp pilus assembly protein PilO